MSDERHAVKVTIFGSEYTIRGEADETYIQTLARYLDEKMKAVADGTNLTNALKIAILAGVNLSDEVFRLRDQAARRPGESSGLKDIAPEAVSALAAHIDAALAEE